MIFNLFLGIAVGFILCRSVNAVALNVEYKKGFLKGYGKGLHEFNVANYKIMTRTDYLKSEIVTSIVHIPDSEDIHKEYMNDYRAQESEMLNDVRI